MTIKLVDEEEFLKLSNDEVADYIQTHDFKLTKEKRQISQKQRNILRDRLIQMTAEAIEEMYGITGEQTLEGYMLELQSDQLGSIVVELPLKIKNLDFNIYDVLETE